MSDDKKKPIHEKKVFNGTPASEIHRKYAFGNNRCICGEHPAIQIKAFATAADLDRYEPSILLKIAKDNGGRVPVAEFTYGKFVRMATVYACDRCRSTAEKAAASMPSWVLVEINAGPNPNNAVNFQVPQSD
jgi:hypothetical protein